MSVAAKTGVITRLKRIEGQVRRRVLRGEPAGNRPYAQHTGRSPLICIRRYGAPAAASCCSDFWG